MDGGYFGWRVIDGPNYMLLKKSFRIPFNLKSYMDPMEKVRQLNLELVRIAVGISFTREHSIVVRNFQTISLWA